MTARELQVAPPANKRLRVAVFAPFPPLLGGMAELAKLISDGLEQDGLTVRRVNAGTGHTGVWSLPILYFRVLFAAISSDVVQIISGSGAALLGKDLPCLIIARLMRRWTVLDFVGGAAVDSVQNWGWWRRLPFRLAHVVVVPTKSFRNALENSLEADFFVIPHVVEIEPFLAVSRPPSGGIPVLLAAKGLSSYAGVDLLIRAMPLVRTRFPDCQLWIAGDGPARSDLESLAAAEAPGSVRFLGPVSHDRMPQVMARASLFVHGTRYESFGLALVEAMAASRPVVAFSVGGIPDVVVHGRTGFLVPYGDVAAFAERVVFLLDNESQSRSMGEEARAWSHHFAWEEIRHHWQDMLQARAHTRQQPTGDSRSRLPERPALLWIGNQVSGTRGTKGVSEHIARLLRAQGWTTYSASSHENRLLRLADMLLCTLRQRRRFAIGVVDVYSGLALRYAEIVSTLLCWMGKPILLVLHGGGLVEFARKHPERLRRLLQRARLVVSPSRYLCSGLASLRSDIRYLPNGLDCSEFAFRPRTDFKPRLCWVRAFSKVYNPQMAVKCLASLRKDFPSIRLTMLGPDPKDGTFAATKRCADQLGLQNALDIVGSVPHSQIPDALQHSDIFLNTTNYESFGVSVMEAAAAGLCIVSTNVGELPLLWQDGRDALLVQPNDSGAMAAAVKRILTEPELGKALSQHARSKAEQFDWSRVLPQWELLLTDLAQ